MNAMRVIAFCLNQSKSHAHIDEIRREALERLYTRLEIIDDAIRTLEKYQRFSPSREPKCIPCDAGRSTLKYLYP